MLAPGVERFPVRGGGSVSVAVSAGDRITLMDNEGLQAAELVFLSEDGRAEPEALLPEAGSISGSTGQAAGTRAILRANPREESADRLHQWLLQLGVSPEKLRSIDLTEPTQAGDYQDFRAEKTGYVIAVSAFHGTEDATGNIMLPWQQQFATPLTLYVTRQNPQSLPEHPVAAPLADTMQDLNVQPGQAKAYEVRAGDYIQILDVQGRECSDFQAISLAGLTSGGVDQAIDPTTTRSLMGNGYPLPGLYSKYWSMAQEPLVEIIQDTCGRHDTFGLACTARYYDDLGYPGHLNCSENMNRALEPWQVAPRAGWPAINFFYNTNLDEANLLGMDDPWSRPGDYVLLRALSDLVCVSTACPCDIDPANGWNPTDIQVRVYDRQKLFRKSIAYRKTTEADMENTRETGFHPSFARHTRNFVEYNGYWLANDMTNHGVQAEYWACREKAVVIDLSPLRKYEVTGPDAEALLQYCLPRDIKRLSVGQVVYSAMCYPHGGMIDDGTLFRLGDNNFRWIGGNDTSGEWLREQAAKLKLQAWVRNSTEQLCNISVQGPKSNEILAPLVWTPPTQPTLTELKWFRFAIGRIGDYSGLPVVISRTGYTGELGYEIFCHPRDAVAVFDAVQAAGEAHGMLPAGLAALDMLRVESGLIFAGCEFDDQTDPFEAGIGFSVARNKTDDYIGRESLLRRGENPQRKLVGLDLDGPVVPAGGDCVRDGRAQIGQITSAVRSPILGKVIALCRIDSSYSDPGTIVEVGQLDGQQKRLTARVVPFPHFDPEKRRVRGDYDQPV